MNEPLKPQWLSNLESGRKNTRELRHSGHELIHQYIEDSSQKHLLDKAEEIGWNAYSASKTDDEIHGALFLIARTLLFKERYSTALEYVRQALEYKGKDNQTLELQEKIQQAQQDSSSVPVLDVQTTETVESAIKLPTYQQVRNSPPQYKPISASEHLTYKEHPLSIRYFYELAGDEEERDASRHGSDIETIDYEAPPWPEL